MSMFIRILLLAISLLSVWGNGDARAQTPSQEYATLSNRLLETRNLDMEASVTLYRADAPSVVLDNSTFRMQRSGEMFRILMPGGVEYIRGNDFYLVVDHERREVMYDRFPPGLFNPPSGLSAQMPLALVDSLMLKQGCRSEVVSREGNVTTLRVTPPRNSEVQAIEVTFEGTSQIKSLRLFKWHYEERDSQTPTLFCLEYKYTRFNPNASFAPSTFSSQDFLEQVGNRLLLKQRYSSYHFDNLSAGF